MLTAVRLVPPVPATASVLTQISLSAAAWSHDDAARSAEATNVDVTSAAADASALLKETTKPAQLLSKLSASGMTRLSASQITLVGAVVNVLLALTKLVVGSLSGSAALLADAYHSTSDLVVDGVTMVAVHGSPAFERGCTFTIAALLTSAGAAMVCDAVATLKAPSPSTAIASAAPLASVAPFAVALVAVASKEAMYRATRQVALRLHSALLLASAKHHRSDALSSLAAAVGTCGVLVGLPMADALAAAAVGAMLVHMGYVVARGEH